MFNRHRTHCLTEEGTHSSQVHTSYVLERSHVPQVKAQNEPAALYPDQSHTVHHSHNNGINLMNNNKKNFWIYDKLRKLNNMLQNQWINEKSKIKCYQKKLSKELKIRCSENNERWWNLGKYKTWKINSSLWIMNKAILLKLSMNTKWLTDSIQSGTKSPSHFYRNRKTTLKFTWNHEKY